jgi:hypothetical protein
MGKELSATLLRNVAQRNVKNTVISLIHFIQLLKQKSFVQLF